MNPNPSSERVRAGLRRPWRLLAAGTVAALFAAGTAVLALPANAEEAPPGDPVAAVEVLETTEAPAGDAGEGAAAEEAAAAGEEAPAPSEEEAPAPAEPVDEAPEAEPAETPVVEDTAPAEASDADAPLARLVEAPIVAALVPPGEEVVDKVEICHGTASYKNPYVINEPAADGDVSGHADHTGPIFWPGIPKHTAWGDIIPPFYYDDGGEFPAFFPGLNWTEEGQAIYENDCAIPTPEPTMTLSGGLCDVYSVEPVIVTLDGVQENVDYLIEVWQGDALVGTSGVSEESGVVEVSFWLDPGDYTVTLQQSIIDGVWEQIASGSITVEACPELGIGVTPGACSIGANGTATISLTGLIEGEEYGWEVIGDDYGVSDSFVAGGATAELALGDLPPGSFVAAVWWTGGEGVSAWTSFDVEPCQPQITVEVTECPAAGDTGSALLKLSNLVAGVEYEVAVTDRSGGTPHGGVHTVMGDEAGTAQLSVTKLPAGRDYTAWVGGVWEAPVIEEIAIAAVADGSVELHASVDFSLKPCPAAPVKPAGLAETGAGLTEPLLAGGAALLALGALVTALGLRRRHGERG